MPKVLFTEAVIASELLLALTIWGLVDVRLRGYPYPQTPWEHKTRPDGLHRGWGGVFDGRPPYEVSNPRGWTYLYPPLFAMLLAPLHPLPMQYQVMAWFFISLVFCWGCYRQFRRIVEIVIAENPVAAGRWRSWLPWLIAAAAAAALIGTLNCLHAGRSAL